MRNDMIDLLSDYCKKIELDITDTQLQQFDDYYRFLVEKNKVMNLTTIIEKEDVVLKHFIDSIYIMKYTDFDEKKVIDIGTGAGFPGIPLAIMNPQTLFVLLDSLNKRINFLNEVCNLCNLSNVITIHGRAEEISRKEEYREKFDYVVSRAVANMSTLLEYCTPFLKVGGQFISYKSGKVEEELSGAQNAMKILGCKLNISIDFQLPNTNMDRKFVIYDKINKCAKKYPRQGGKPRKEPL
jgi:16S rRNA (guanine527-N7)-methyltransferase